MFPFRDNIIIWVGRLDSGVSHLTASAHRKSISPKSVNWPFIEWSFLTHMFMRMVLKMKVPLGALSLKDRDNPGNADTLNMEPIVV